MVTVELRGGLGNQLFQYAAGIGLACHLKTGLITNITDLLAPDKVLGTYRTFKLNYLNEPPVINNRVNEKKIIQKTKKILQKLNIGSDKLYKEKFFHYNPAFWMETGNVLITGNFQSEKYFLPYKSIVLDKLQFNKSLLSLSDKELLTKIMSAESLSVHIRRGDYLSNKIANDVLGVLPVAYYENAYEEILKKSRPKTIFIFSDDIKWAKENLRFINEVTFVESKGNNSDLCDFILMQHCSHNIIANSSFSWWAAYLNPNPNKIVIAPKRWFNKAPYDTKDLIPENWIRL